ncbi:MAG: tRNA glutamyl-Q(34) synthetase GluQRS [Sterolibacterium sp.]|jgi:glutamyl-Q tRNA(Asp) synthetase|nr:tRNA glutamyl-Q(34) synthetase GluQRS [Sterolibacterium sp.]
MPYRGRFAPSPTGPLHFGSLVAAVGSYLDARAHGGHWFVRIEDLDRPRCQLAAADAILRLLDAYGFEWAGEVLYQSARDEIYRAAFEQLRATGQVYACACTRSELADSRITITHPAARAADGALIYPGTCRHGLPAGRSARAWRLRVDEENIAFTDAVCGIIGQSLADEAGDFVLRRADGLYAYQLAVVVDDAAQGVTHVVRGADLLGSTPRQILLQHRLGLATPQYAHLPVVLDAHGEKLSKQTHAAPLVAQQAIPALLAALEFLGQQPPEELRSATRDALWQWAVAHWSMAGIPCKNASFATQRLTRSP